ncbi:MAG: PD-(D/E)XK nuclease family protein, partial [bacterium]|nr:PD-(D/E)XK nuclease family protein [bacterium]
NVSSETPHQYFQDGERMSEIRSKFDKTDMIVRSKSNYANKTAEFVLRSVPDNKSRHEALQRFMIANDSVTVATEVPVYIREEDIMHMENVLKFKILGEGGLVFKGKKDGRSAKASSARGRLLTGHIDIVQIRNGMVHILDYKPNASKEKPIEQLTWYALALSRLTGLRLFEFKCAWFDDKDFYEFYPLHIVKKLQTKRPAAGVAGASGRRQRKRIIHFKDGTKAEVPREDVYVVT